MPVSLGVVRTLEGALEGALIPEACLGWTGSKLPENKAQASLRTPNGALHKGTNLSFTLKSVEFVTSVYDLSQRPGNPFHVWPELPGCPRMFDFVSLCKLETSN